MKPEKAIIHISRAIDSIEFEAIQEAVLALEKQIPKEVFLSKNGRYCPACRRIQDAVNYYCWNCGQRLNGRDWRVKMAKVNMDIPIRFTVDEQTAECCLKAVEIYVNNNGKDVKSIRCKDGTIKLEFTEDIYEK